MNKTKRILIVDDEEANRELLEAFVVSLGHEAETACDGVEALAKLALDIDLVLLDVMMPGLDGFKTAGEIRNSQKYHEYRDLPIIMVTALTSKQDRLRSVEAGTNDFITKPVDKVELKIRMASLLKMKEAQDDVKRHEGELEEKVKDRTEQLRNALEDSVVSARKTREAYIDTIQRLLIAAEYKDEDTANHLKRMSTYSAILARRLNCTPNEIEIIQLASPMHDVGKLGTPDNILFKPGKHTPEEWTIMKQHATFGGHILHGSSSDLIETGEIIALSHHEKWDGSGYPNGLAGEKIPLFGRICAVADVFDALTSKRPYKEAFSIEKSLNIMKEGKGKHFEPKLIDLFMADFDEILTVKEQYKDK